MRGVGVVLVAPGFDHLLGLGQGAEVMLVEALLPELAVEALDQAVLDQMPGANEVQGYALDTRPLVERETHKLGTVVAHDGGRPPAYQEQRVQRLDHARGRQRALAPNWSDSRCFGACLHG